jgi:hypothetical protein
VRAHSNDSVMMLVFVAMSIGCTTSNGHPAGAHPAGARPFDPAQAAVSGRVSGQRPGSSTEANASRKTVDAKQDPATLVASDRSECVVTAERYRDVKVGDKVICDWRAGTRAP